MASPLALWGEAVLGAGTRGQSFLLATLDKHCAGFVAGRSRLQRSEPLALDLLEWVHTQRFGYAKQQGWLEALIFYGVRHPFSRGAWAYWENCEAKWNQTRAVSLPTFEQWWRSALQWPLCEEAACAAIAAAVKRYLDWEALTLWLRPSFFGSSGLPPHALSELVRRFPRFSNLNDLTKIRDLKTRASMWRRVTKVGNDRLLLQARKAGILNHLLEQVRSHPWQVRIHAYAACREQELDHSPTRSFFRWEQAAASYIKPTGTARWSFESCGNLPAHFLR